jgi:glycosyltransferase involved in cell wall biosynthesis
MDAVGNFCLDLADCLGIAGFPTKLYAINLPPWLSGKVGKISDLFQNIRPHDLLIVSYSTYDTRLSDILKLPNPKVCYFHGVTPPGLLEKFDPSTAEVCRKSTTQFPQLAMFDVVMANSLFTSSVLAPYMANRPVGIAPPIFPPRLEKIVRLCAAHDDADGLTLLFVGRVAPHKRIGELFHVLAEIRRSEPSARLVVVGKGTNQRYLDFLRNYAARLRIPQDKIVLTGRVSDADLAQRYLSADAFLCMSLHEGFGIPVLEAMAFGLPVFIRDGNATAEVTGDSGIRFQGNDYSAIANLILRTLSDRETLAGIVHRGHLRHQSLIQQNTPAFWKSVCDTARQVASHRLGAAVL